MKTLLNNYTRKNNLLIAFPSVLLLVASALFSVTAFAGPFEATCTARSCIGSTGGGNGGGGSSCPTAESIHLQHEAGGGLCTGTVANFDLPYPVLDIVDWDWALSVYSGSILNAGDVASILYPASNWTGFNLNVCATASLDDGTECETVCKIEELNCN